jgi:hypothetical protein
MGIALGIGGGQSHRGVDLAGERTSGLPADLNIPSRAVANDKMLTRGDLVQRSFCCRAVFLRSRPVTTKFGAAFRPLAGRS